MFFKINYGCRYKLFTLNAFKVPAHHHFILKLHLLIYDVTVIKDPPWTVPTIDLVNVIKCIQYCISYFILNTAQKQILESNSLKYIRVSVVVATASVFGSCFFYSMRCTHANVIVYLTLEFDSISLITVSLRTNCNTGRHEVSIKWDYAFKHLRDWKLGCIV